MIEYTVNTIELEKYSIQYLICSAKGQSHALRNMENQDSAGVYHNDCVFACAVADGLGSCKNSKEGSTQAVSVIGECIQSDITEQSCEKIRDYIVNSWREKVGLPYDAYSTTLRFVILKQDRLIIGDIGDGLTVVNNGSVIQRSSSAWFANCTDALSDTISHFKVLEIPIETEHLKILLTTDGIANDIKPGCEGDLLNYLCAIISSDTCETEIDEWIESICKNNGDDKTFVVVKIEGK